MATHEDSEAMEARFKEIADNPAYCQEAWTIVQALTMRDAPSLYLHIQTLRTEIMRDVYRQLESATTYGDFSFRPIKRSATGKPWKRDYGNWRLIDITPEIATDPKFTYISVPTKLARALRRAIKEQIWLMKRYE